MTRRAEDETVLVFGVLFVSGVCADTDVIPGPAPIRMSSLLSEVLFYDWWLLGGCLVVVWWLFGGRRSGVETKERVYKEER
jgi:hypothetical protein